MFIIMALFHTKTFTKNDDYMTPSSAWQAIQHIIPQNKTIWECFYGDGSSGDNLRELGFDVIHEDMDFFKNDVGDVLVSNPPFTIKKEVFTRLKELGKPFIMIAPCSMINTNYIHQLFQKDTDLQIVIPAKRIQFLKVGEECSGRCNFDCFYYCYKIGLEQSITWL